MPPLIKGSDKIEGGSLRVALIGVFDFAATGGGAPGRLRNLAVALKQAGQEPHLFQTGVASGSFAWGGIAVEQFGRAPSGASGGWRWPRRVNDHAVDAMGARLTQMRRAGGLDLVIFYNQDLAYAWRILQVCRRLGMPFVQQYAERHQSVDFAGGWRNTYFLSEVLHLHLVPLLSDGNIVISHALRRFVERRGAASTLLIPTISQLPSLPVTAGNQPQFRVVCVSRGARRDDLPLLIRAARILVGRQCAVDFHVIGLDPGSRILLANIAREAGVSERVRLDGFLSDSEFAAALSNASLMLLLRTDDLSSRACFPSRLHELFSQGVPVLLSDVGDLSSYFRDGTDCLLVPPGNAEEVASRIEWAAAHRAELETIGKQGHLSATNLFAPQRHGHLLAHYLASVCRVADRHQ